MALDPSLSHTDGLDPDFGQNRNKQHVTEVLRRVLGPTPVDEFIDNFLPSPPSSDRSSILSARSAFKSIPPKVTRSAAIYEPLVSSILLLNFHVSQW